MCFARDSSEVVVSGLMRIDRVNMSGTVSSIVGWGVRTFKNSHTYCVPIPNYS